jgi:hypothetical protein
MHRAVPSTDGQAVASLTQDLSGDGQRFLRIAGQKAIRRRAKVLDLGQKIGEEPFPLAASGGWVDDDLDFHPLPGKTWNEISQNIFPENKPRNRGEWGGNRLRGSWRSILIRFFSVQKAKSSFRPSLALASGGRLFPFSGISSNRWAEE